MSELFNELKRRNVIRVAIAYAVVGWLVIEVIDTIAPRMAMPEWVPGFFIILVLVGFPIALLFSWAFEMTPQGLKKTAEVDADDSITHSTGRKLDFIIIGALVVTLGYFVWDKFGAGPTSEEVTAEAQSEEVRSIAVLPFADMSPEGDQEYFSDGIAEELLNVLAKVPGLRVAARTSSFQFKGENRDVVEIAKQLRVAHIIEGSVRKSGTRLRITAQLIDAEEGFHIWSETYDRELDDIFAIQDEIAAAIVEALVKRLNLAPAAVPKVRAAASSEAYDAYLLGIHEMEKRGPGPLARAAEQFEKALQIDPDYIPAMARLSITYLLLPGYDFANNPLGEMRAKARPLAEKALALAPDLPEAQAAMGFYYNQVGNRAAAEPYFKRALELNPSYATVQVWLARLNQSLGRYEAHLAMLEAAVRIDPLSELALTNLAGAYLDRKMMAKALPIIERLKTLQPAFYIGQRVAMLQAEGRFAEAAITNLEALAIDRNENGRRSDMANLLENQFGLYRETVRYNWFPITAHFRLGEVEKAKAVMATFEPLIPPDNVYFRSFIGAFHLVTGDKAKALAELERAREMVSDRPGVIGSYGGLGILALIAIKHQDGDEAGVKDLVERSLAFLDGREAANMIGPSGLSYRGWFLIYSDQAKEGLESLRRSVEAGYGPDFFEDYLMKQFPSLDFAPIMAIFEARRDVERDKFLKTVCNDGNPAAEAWTPLPETCEGYVEG